MMDKTQSLTYTAPKQAEIQLQNLPLLGETDILIKGLYSGISLGTERLVFNGCVPQSEWQRMACPNQIGSFSFPVSYGYQFVGEIVACGEEVKNLQKGDIVFTLNPHQEYATLSEEMAHKIPPSLPAKRAVLSANMETALNAFWDSDAQESDTIAVVGGGVVGLLTAYCASHFLGTDVTLIDIDGTKKTIAETLGLRFKTPEEVQDKFNVLFHTSASEQGLQLAINLASFEGRIIEMSWYGDKKLALHLGGAFHSQRLQIISSQVGHISPKKRLSFTYRDRMREVLKLLEDERLDNLLEEPIAFKALPKYLNTLFNEQTGLLCQLVRYDDNPSGENECTQ